MYKTSNYNWFIPYNGNLIYYNGLSKSSFVLNRDEHDKMKKQFEDLITFDLEYPSIFKQFKEWGFIVEEGLDELNIIRFDYMNEVLNNRNYKLSIIIEESVNELFVSSISNHVQDMCEREKITSLHLEFVINEICDSIHINTIESVIVSTRRLCADFSIKLKSHIVINNATISKSIIGVIQQLKSVAFNIILSKQKEQNLEIYSNLEILSKDINNQILLHIVYDDKCSVELLDQFLSQIDKRFRNNIVINMTYNVFDRQKLVAEKKLLDNNMKLLKFKENTHNDNEPTFLRSFQNAITTSLKVRLWSDSYELDDCGVLQSDGGLVWNKFKRNSLLGRFWFDNKMCAQCKCLPILFGICSKAIRYNGNSLEMSCVLQDKSVRPESIIVKLHEAK